MSKTGWKIIGHVERIREHFSDPLMQLVRDKCETLDALREAIGDKMPLFTRVFRDVSEYIRKRENTEDMFFNCMVVFRDFSVEREVGIDRVLTTIDCKGDRIMARAKMMMVQDLESLKGDGKSLEEK